MLSIRYGDMVLTVETVTPAVAARWLTLNDGNRRLRTTVVAQYATDMTDGNWHRKPVAICFDQEGRLGNGQHTLSAIVKSGEPQELLIARHVDRKSIAMMDRGIQRTINDVAKFLGSELEGRRAGIARILAYGNIDTYGQSFDMLFNAYMFYKEPIDFVVDQSPKMIGLNNQVLAVCAKAYYSIPSHVITRFIEIMRTGEAAGEHENAAIRLRDFCRGLRGANTRALRLETYNKAMSALASFAAGKPMSKVYGTSNDLFPIPMMQEAQ